MQRVRGPAAAGSPARFSNIANRDASDREPSAGQQSARFGNSISDVSGDRLREWTGLSQEQFYDSRRVAILPMGFCYPGRATNGGDASPRPECASLWRSRLLAALPSVRLTLLVGSYAQASVLGLGAVSERVRDFRSYLPRYFPLPHPSWRSRIWSDRNPWFEGEVLPALRREIEAALGPKSNEQPG